MRRVVARRQILEVAVPPPSSHPPALVIRCGAGVLLVAAALAFASHLATAQPLFGPRADYPAGDEPRAIAIADFNEDGWPDIVTTSLTAPTVAILLNHRDGTFAAPVFWAVGSPAGDVAVGDMNTDDHLDLVVTQASTSTVSVRTGNGDGTFHSLLHYGVGLEPVGVGIADFNHDGHPDLAVVNAGTRTCCASASVLLADSGGFTSEPLLHLTRSPIAIGVRDFSGDGILDLVVTDNESGSVTVMLGTEGGAFGAGTDFYAGLYPHHLAIGDLDGDGRPDLVVGADTGFNTLLGSGGGTFGTPTHFDGGTTPAVTLGDLDGDGRLDVATADWDSDSASVHLGRGDGTFGTRIGFPAGHRCAGPGALAPVEEAFQRVDGLRQVRATEADPEVRVAEAEGR